MSIQTTMDTLKKLFVYNIFLAILAVIGFLFWNSVFVTESGYIYHFQDRIMRKESVIFVPGLHFRLPFSFRVTRYTRAWTVSFGDFYSGYQVRRKGPLKITFADSYTAAIPANFRFKLPGEKDSEKWIIRIHQDFRSFDELIDSLLIEIARDVAVNTATQFTGEEFFLGGFNQFKAALADQLRDGVYKTERKQFEVEEMGLARIGIGQEKSTQMQKTTKLVWKTVPIRGEDNKVVRLENPLDYYGIEVTQITLGEPVAERQLQTMLVDNKGLVAERIKAVQTQETTREQAKTVQLKFEIERIRDSQKKINEKEMALIDKQREIEEAKKQAEKEIVEYEKAKDLVFIQKAKELVIVQENQKIELAEKAKNLAVVQAGEKIQLAKKAEELAIVEAEQKIQLAKKAEELAIVEAERKIQLARRAKKLAIVEAEKKIQLAKKSEELAVSQANKEIQKANFESAQFEAQAIQETGIAEAKIIKAKYDALNPDIYMAEIKRDIAGVIYPNLKGINLTMPHNIVNLGADKESHLQTNLDVLSSFATIGVMDSLEKKAQGHEIKKGEHTGSPLQ